MGLDWLYRFIAPEKREDKPFFLQGIIAGESARQMTFPPLLWTGCWPDQIEAREFSGEVAVAR